MGLNLNDSSGKSFDKSTSKKKGGASAPMSEGFWVIFGLLLTVCIIYLLAVSSQHARTVPVESHAPDGTRINTTGRSR